MHEYEVLIETINPCGGEAHSKKEFLDVEACSVPRAAAVLTPGRTWTAMS